MMLRGGLVLILCFCIGCGWARRRRRSSHVPSAFLEKLYEMLEEPAHFEFISWSKSGETIIIKKVAEFSSMVLPKYYKHNNFQSFVRQLNMYSFSKTRHDANWREFKQDMFQRGRRDLLHQIRRKTGPPQAKSKTGSASEVDAAKGSEASTSSLQAQLDEALVEVRAMRHRMATFETHIWLLNERCNTVCAENEKLQRQMELLQTHSSQPSQPRPASARPNSPSTASRKAIQFEVPTLQPAAMKDALLLKDDDVAALQRQSSITIQHTHTQTHSNHPLGSTHSIATSATYSTNDPGEASDSGDITEALVHATRTGIEALAVAANLRSRSSGESSHAWGEPQPKKRLRMSLDDLLDAATLSAAAGLSMVSKAQPLNSAGVQEGIGKLVQTMTASPKNQDYLTSCTGPFTKRANEPTATAFTSTASGGDTAEHLHDNFAHPKRSVDP